MARWICAQFRFRNAIAAILLVGMAAFAQDVHVEFKNGGQVFADQTVALPEPDANGAIAMFVGAATRPGNCELQITALQGGQSATEKIAYLGSAK